MVKLGEVGHIAIPKEFLVEWVINDIFSLTTEVGKSYTSPSFIVAGVLWHFKIYLNGATEIRTEDGQEVDTEGYVNVYLYRRSPGLPIHIEFSLRLNLGDKFSGPEKYYTFVFKNCVQGYGSRRLMKTSELLEFNSKIQPSDIISVVCRVTDPTGEGVASKAALKCSYCKTIFEGDEDISTHQKKCMDKPIKCPDCDDVIPLKNWYDHECHTTTEEASEKLSQDFKALMLSGDLSDLIIRVKEQEFRVHRNILSARSPYLASMFKREIKENFSGILSIDDCDPDTFRHFIHFLYTGKVNKLTEENVYKLFEVAAMYQEDYLKNACLQFIRKTVLHTDNDNNTCDFIAAA